MDKANSTGARPAGLSPDLLTLSIVAAVLGGLAGALAAFFEPHASRWLYFAFGSVVGSVVGIVGDVLRDLQ